MTNRNTRRLAALLVGGVVAASAGAVAPSAEAATVCRQVIVSGMDLGQACVTGDATPGASGTTVAPWVTFQCSQTIARTALVDSSRCGLPPVSTGLYKTGFEPATTVPDLYVDPATGTVRLRVGLLGRLWINGTYTNIVVGETCVGDPSIC